MDGFVTPVTYWNKYNKMLLYSNIFIKKFEISVMFYMSYALQYNRKVKK